MATLLKRSWWILLVRGLMAVLFSVLDMAGNVREWVADWWDDEYYNGSPYENPTGPNHGPSRVTRGASWDMPWGWLYAHTRLWQQPGNKENVYGFRCVHSP